MSQRDQQPAKILVVHTVDNVPVPQGARRGRTTVEAAEVGGLTEDRSGISYQLDAKRIVRIPWANIRAIEVEAK